MVEASMTAVFTALSFAPNTRHLASWQGLPFAPGVVVVRSITRMGTGTSCPIDRLQNPP